MTNAERDAPPPTQQEFRQLLGDSPGRAAELLRAVHPADVASWLQDVDGEDGWHVFAALDTEKRAEVLEHAEPGLRERFVPRLSAGDLGSIVDELPPDEAVDVLAFADARVAEDVLVALPRQEALELRKLIAHPPESAGGVMTSDFVSVREGTRLGDAIKRIKQEGESLEGELGLYVVDERGRPAGYIPVHDLLTHSIHATVDEVMVPPFTVRVDEDQEAAAGLISKYALGALAVVDGDGRLVGVISAEDAQVVREIETEEDILRLVGTAPAQQQTRLPILKRVRQRLPLMGVTVLGGLLTAWLLALFLGGGEASGAVSTTAILRYLPIIIGLAGNVGIQSSTILVRGFATGEVEPERERQVLVSEVAVGLLIGLLCGGVTAFVAGWMEQGAEWLAAGAGPARSSFLFGGSVGAAIAIAVTWAAFLGCLVPMGCRRFGIDPAIAAGPFLICLSDVSGSAIYLGVATGLLEGLL